MALQDFQVNRVPEDELEERLAKTGQFRLAPFGLTWETTQVGNSPPYGWIISNNGLSVRFDIEDSFNCGGANDSPQAGDATSSFEIFSTSWMTVEIDGLVELQDEGFERFTLVLDGRLLLSATSRDLNLECQMGEPSFRIFENGPYRLDPGQHTLQISVDTVDGAFHTGAFYECRISISGRS